nr:hypothetical protein [Morganella morganii]
MYKKIIAIILLIALLFFFITVLDIPFTLGFYLDFFLESVINKF